MASLFKPCSSQTAKKATGSEWTGSGPARGLSNVRTGADAAVAIRRGRLLIVESAT